MTRGQVLLEPGRIRLSTVRKEVVHHNLLRSEWEPSDPFHDVCGAFSKDGGKLCAILYRTPDAGATPKSLECGRSGTLRPLSHLAED